MFPIQFSNEKENLLKLLIKQKEETRHLQVFIVVTDVMKMQLFPHLLFSLGCVELRSSKWDHKKGRSLPGILFMSMEVLVW